MELIVKRSGLGTILTMILLDAFMCFFSIWTTISFLTDDSPMLSIGGVLLLIGGTVFLIADTVREIKTSKKIISYKESTDELYLHSEDVTIHLKDIDEINYVNDRDYKGMHRELLRGTLTITAANKKYTFVNVSFVDDAAHKIGVLVGEYRQRQKK